MTNDELLEMLKRCEAQVYADRKRWWRLTEVLRIGDVLDRDNIVAHIERVVKERESVLAEVGKLQERLDCIRKAFAIIKGDNPNLTDED